VLKTTSAINALVVFNIQLAPLRFLKWLSFYWARNGTGFKKSVDAEVIQWILLSICVGHFKIQMAC
jgi:hypothetical protein